MKEENNSSAKKLHILLATSWYPNEDQPYLGNFIEQFALSLSKRHIVTVLYLDYSTKNNYGISEERIHDDLTICRSFVPKGKSLLHKYFGHRIAATWIKEHYPNVDLIHSVVSVRDWWHFVRLQKKLKAPLITTEHGSYLSKNQFDKLSVLKRRGIKKLWRKSKVVTAVSDYLKDEITKMTDTKVEVIGNFIPDEWFETELTKPNNETYQFLHISTLDDNKNFQGILEACKTLKDKGITNWKFTVISEEKFSHYEDWILENGLFAHFTFKTHIGHADLKNEYANHHCFVLNSNTETFSIVNAEALSMGLHLISTKVGFLASSNDSTLDFIEMESSSSITTAMETSITQNKWNGQKGREIISEFSEKKILDRFDKVYNS